MARTHLLPPPRRLRPSRRAGLQTPPTLPPEQLEFFEKRIRPVLAEQCAKCHSAESEKLKSGLLLDSRSDILKGSTTGPAAIPGDPEKCALIEAIRYTNEDLQMPPKHRLTAEQVRDFEEWVRMGLPDPRAAAGGANSRTGWRGAWSKAAGR